MEHKKSLSRREKQVAALLMQGKSNKQIAAALHISERTVEFHLKNIYDKLKVESRVELVLKLGKSTGDSTGDPVESTVVIPDDQVHNGEQTGSRIHWAQSLRRIVPGNGKEFAMTGNIRILLSVITALMGIVLIIGGIITDRNGAVVVGMCVSAAAVTTFIRGRTQPNQDGR
jgi:DNA-binding CsgD family transcriptional regulator